MGRKTAKESVWKNYIKKGNLLFDAMMAPGIIFLIIFQLVPMYGFIMAFQNFIPSKGIFHSEFVGLTNFVMLFDRPEMLLVIRNTFLIAFLKIVFTFPVPIIFAILMNEVRNAGLKKGIQIIVYLPNFISWVVMAGVILQIFAYDGGVINNFLGLFGADSVNWLGKGGNFLFVLIFTEIWKGFGWGSVIYLASLSNVDTNLYEAAVIDGARRWKQTIHITLPAMVPIITLSFILSLGNIVNAGFDQIFNLQNDLVTDVSEIIDTYVYKLYNQEYAWSESTIVGLMKSIVSMVFILSGWAIAKRTTGYSVL